MRKLRLGWIASGVLVGLLIGGGVWLSGQGQVASVPQLVGSTAATTTGGPALRVLTVDTTGVYAGGGAGGGGGTATLTEQQTQTAHLSSIQTATEATTTALTGFAPACNASAPIEVAGAGNWEIVPLSAGAIIYVCDVTIIVDGTVSAQWVYGTGTNCGTGEQILSGVMPLGIAGTAPPGYTGHGIVTPVSQALCLELSGAPGAHGHLSYVQYAP